MPASFQDIRIFRSKAWKKTPKNACDKPFVFTNMKTGEGIDTVFAFIQQKGMLKIS